MNTTDKTNPLTVTGDNAAADNLLSCCLYFTSGALTRAVNKMADEEFAKIGLTSSHAMLLMIVHELAGASQKELTVQMDLAQSTVSRLVDALAARGLLEKTGAGKNVLIKTTPQGRAILPVVEKAWCALYERYCAVLGEECAKKLTADTYQAALKLK